MKHLNAEQVFYSFSPELKPLLTVAQGETFSLESKDCYGNQLQSCDDTLADMDWSTTNPATGPVYIEGIKSGDTVCFTVENIELIGNSVMATIPGSGKVSGIDTSETCVMDNSGSFLKVPTKCGLVSIPVNPMIGVIGVAPASGKAPNAEPGFHGGNMDCNRICRGSRLYLKAQVDGALFGCGDVHAVMGDGEVVVCGAETPSRITLHADKVDKVLPTPFLETEEIIAAINSDKDLEAAYQGAIDNMFDFLTKTVGLSSGDAGRLLSLAGDLRICQVVDPLYTVRMEFPKSVLRQIGFTTVF